MKATKPPAGLLPNLGRLHRLATSLSGTTDADDHSIEILGPPPGTYTSYRTTVAGRNAVLAEARICRSTNQVVKREPEPFLFED